MLRYFLGMGVLMPLITAWFPGASESREDDLLCSRLKAGRINGQMTLTLGRTDAIRFPVQDGLL